MFIVPAMFFLHTLKVTVHRLQHPFVSFSVHHV
jgi:hypothetical protein